MASKLFQLASRKARRSARREWNKTDVGKLVNTVVNYTRRGNPSMANVAAKVREGRAQKLLQQLTSGASVTRYGLSLADKNAIDELLNILGPFGNIIKAAIGVGRGVKKTKAQYDAAVEMIRALGDEVITKDTGRSGYQRGVDAAQELLKEAGVDPRTVAQPPRENAGIPRPGRQVDPAANAAAGDPGTHSGVAEPPAEGQQTTLSPMHFTPGSSNVYSFQYDYASSTLYVHFKPPIINTQKVKNVRGKGGLVSITGSGGIHLRGLRANQPGPLYGYFDVPVRVFKRLTSASSAGGAVWDELRVRGSVHGHQYRYSLLQGALVPGEGGELATYVSRRATPKGFRRRSVAEAGAGKRRSMSSGLPESVNRAAPNRGAPNRGTPKRGTPKRGRKPSDGQGELF